MKVCCQKGLRREGERERSEAPWSWAAALLGNAESGEPPRTPASRPTRVSPPPTGHLPRALRAPFCKRKARPVLLHTLSIASRHLSLACGPSLPLPRLLPPPLLAVPARGASSSFSNCQTPSCFTTSPLAALLT